MLRPVPVNKVTQDGEVVYNLRGNLPSKAMSRLFLHKKIYSHPVSALSVEKLDLDGENKKWLEDCINARQIFYVLISHLIYRDLQEVLQSRYESGIEFFPLIEDSAESVYYIKPIDGQNGELIDAKPMTALEAVQN